MTFRVLVVDDNEDHRWLTRRALQTLAGVEVSVAADGAEALRSAVGSPPDVVLLDVKMPGMDGFEVLERLRADAGVAGTRVVLFSSSESVADRARADALGADEFVTKPIDARGFASVARECVERWMRQRRGA